MGPTPQGDAAQVAARGSPRGHRRAAGSSPALNPTPHAAAAPAARRTALVTGASSGIGEAFAAEFAAHGFDLVITARRTERLRATAECLEREHGVHVDVISCDLAADGAAAALCARIARDGRTVDALVNCAGFGVAGRFTGADWTVHEAMLRLTVSAPTELAYRLLPGMAERGYGRIVNVASLAGLVDSGAGALYGAAKTYGVSLSTSLAREVSAHGIHVTAVCPGLTRTEFHDAPALRASVRAMPHWMWMDPATVARQGYAAVMDARPVLVNGRANWLFVALLRVVPRRLLAALGRIARRR